MALTVHMNVHAPTMGPATVLLAPAAALVDIMATPVNTVCKPQVIIITVLFFFAHQME